MKEVGFVLDKESKVINDKSGRTRFKLLLGTDGDDFELDAIEAALDGVAGVTMEIHIDETDQDEIYVSYLSNIIKIPIQVMNLVDDLAQCNDIIKAG